MGERDHLPATVKALLAEARGELGASRWEWGRAEAGREW